MISEFLAGIASWITGFIATIGYGGIFILMACESMVIPFPSELIMPFAGFLASQAKMNLILIIVFSTFGSLFGSLISYSMGKYGGNPFVLKFGKFLLLDERDLIKTEEWFKNQGEKTIFFSRFIPVVRHLISIPAGIGKMDLWKFCTYTVVGAALWNAFLTMLGFWLGTNWPLVKQYSEYLSITVAVFLIIAAIILIYRHIRDRKTKYTLV